MTGMGAEQLKQLRGRLETPAVGLEIGNIQRI
jgi:hypothetical protein